jgi:putative membrane protein
MVLEKDMKKMLLVASCMCALASGSAYAQSQPGYGGAAKSKSGAVSAQGPRLLDVRPFVQETAQGGFAGVELARLALTKGSSDDVRGFAQRMLEASEKINNDMKPFLKTHNVSVPAEIDARHKVTRDWLMTLSGSAFDRAYMAAMNAKLTNDATFYRRASMQANDPDVKTWAAGALPLVQEHQKMASEINRKITGGSR